MNELYTEALDLGISIETFWNSSLAEVIDLMESAYRVQLKRRKQRIEDNCTLAEAIAANVGALFDENSRPFLKPWDFYPKLFEKEQEMYEEAEEERQWAEYSEKRREYVSAWQGKIDWKKVADYGMGFAILRITEAGNIVDKYFEANLTGCNKHKIPVGVYKYSYAMTIAEIQSEARKVVSTLNGRKIQYPVFLDLEYHNQRTLGAESIHKMADAFRKIIEAAGYKFAIYCNVDWYVNVICSHLKKT